MPFTKEEVDDIINQYEQTIKDSESSIEFASQQINILENFRKNFLELACRLTTFKSSFQVSK